MATALRNGLSHSLGCVQQEGKMTAWMLGLSARHVVRIKSQLRTSSPFIRLVQEIPLGLHSVPEAEQWKVFSFLLQHCAAFNLGSHPPTLSSVT